MARSPLYRLVRKLMRRAHAANLGLDPDAIAAEAIATKKAGPSRRDVFFGAMGAAALVPLAAACGDNIDLDDGGPGIAIIGGGMSGLTAAHFLRLAGVRADIYEASMRIGGRMYTDRDSLASGQLVELGGELVDSDHVVMQALCSSFGLALDDLVEATDGLTQDSFVFHDGSFPLPSASARIMESTIVTAFMPVAAKMAAAVALEDDEAAFAAVDNMSIPAWLQDVCGLAPTTLIRRILEISYLEEYGLEPEEQSAWNMIYLIDYEELDPFRIFGDSDERYHIHEGNDALPQRILAGIPEERVHTGYALTKVAKTGDAAYELTFDTAGGSETIAATRVIYALPFTRLREVDLDEAELSEDKRAVIDEIGYGTNAKLMLQFTDRHWEQAPFNSSGGVITDVGDAPSESMLGSGLQSIWATSRGQDGPEGILTNFVGGTRGIDMGGGTPESQAQLVLPWLEKLFPGITAKYVAGSAIRMHWPSYEFTKGSYASYKVGQWQTFYGTEGIAEGSQHFCGEHCSEDYQGYMEGAAETGALVAAEILDELEVAYPFVLSGILDMLGVSERSSPIGPTRTRACYHGNFGRAPKLRDRKKRNWAALAAAGIPLATKR